MRSKDFVFICGITDSIQHAEAISGSKSPHQSAANRFQNALVDGLIALKMGKVYSVSSPFFGSWPINNKIPVIESSVSRRQAGEILITAGYVNLPFVKIFSKISSIFLKCKSIILKRKIKFVICYSGNVPYISSLVLAKMFFKEIITCVIVTDLPNYPADCSLAYRLYMQYIESPLFGYLVRRVDCCVVLTEYMISELDLIPEKCLVIEGIYSGVRAYFDDPFVDDGVFKILYTGTLDHRYGILDLLNAMETLRSYPISLTVCGQGACADEVIARSKLNSMIKFMGYVPPDVIGGMQQSADLLVNPRNNVGAHNKFSFPSKTMEYLASGTPVLMYRLDGIPSDYIPHIFFVDVDSGESFSDSILRIFKMDPKFRSDFGFAARDFIFNNKSSIFQVKKIVDFLNKIDKS